MPTAELPTNRVTVRAPSASGSSQAPSSARARRARSTGLALAWVIAISLAVVGTFANLGVEQWRTDEPVYRNAAVAISEYDNYSHNLEHPPLVKYAMAASMSLFGDSTVGARLPAAIATIVAGLLLAALCTRIVREQFPAAAPWAGLVTFLAWSALPHPDPAFDVTRLAYLDVPMAAFLAAAMYAGWRWQEVASRRWAVLTGVLAGLAVACKLPALLLAVALLALVVGHRARQLGRQYLLIVLVAASTFVATWAPVGGELAEAWRFMLAMQARGGAAGVDPSQQFVWQWQAWPAFALVQLASVGFGLVALRRLRSAWYVGACLAVPFIVFAIGSSRIHPHWQVAWQPAVAVLIGAATAIAATSRPADRVRATALVTMATASLLIVCVHAVDRARDSLAEPTADIRRAYSLLASHDHPDAIFVDRSKARVERAITRGLVVNSALYTSSAYNKHEWFSEAGGRPLQPERLSITSENADRVAAVVLDSPSRSFNVPFVSADEFVPHEYGSITVWTRSG